MIDFLLYFLNALIAGRACLGPAVAQPDGAVEYEAVRRAQRVEAKVALPFELHRLLRCRCGECGLDSAFGQRFE